MKNNDIVKLQVFQDEAASMLNELDNNRLIVKLDGGQGDQNRSRVVESNNIGWYKELFSQYSNNRSGKNSRNCIRRHRLIKVFENLSKGVTKDRFPYDVVIELIKDRLMEGYYIEEEGIFVPPQLTIPTGEV